MNAAALMAIARYLVYPEVPIAVQGRFLGSKGVWLLHPEDHDPLSPPRIWIRTSQRKINLVDPSLFSPHLPLDPKVLHGVHQAQMIFDVVAPSKVTMPTRLNRLTLANLSDNGVPSELFVELMRDTLEEEVEGLTRWDGRDAMALLWDAVNRATKTTQSRLQRHALGLQRALGLASRMQDDALAKDESQADDEGDESADGDTSPDTIGEKILQRLQAGFSPKEDGQLYDDIKWVIKQTIEKAVNEYHITVPKSVEMFIVPGRSRTTYGRRRLLIFVKTLTVCWKRVRSSVNRPNTSWILYITCSRTSSKERCWYVKCSGGSSPQAEVTSSDIS